MSGFRTSLTSPSAAFGHPSLAVQLASSATSPPETIVLARIAAHWQDDIDRMAEGRVTSSTQHRSGSPERPWVIREGVNDRQDRLNDSHIGSARVVHLSHLINAPAILPPSRIIDVARERGADWLCVFSAHTHYTRRVDALQLLTFGLLPTVSDAESILDALIIDLRTGQQIDQWSARDTGWQPAIGLTAEAASKQTADRAETRALRSVLDRLEDRVIEARGVEPSRLQSTRSSSD